MGMKNIALKEYVSKRSLTIPHWFEIIVKSLIFSMIMLFLIFIKIGNEFLLSSIFIIYSCIFFIAYYLYKLSVTPTAVDKIVFDFINKLIIINYCFLYFKKEIVYISFDDLSFYTKIDDRISGNTLGLRIFENKKFKIKINAHNGWKKDQIAEIIADIEKVGNKRNHPASSVLQSEEIKMAVLLDKKK